jgi:bacillopeptidase F
MAYSSRLQRLQERRNVRKAVLLSIGSVIIVVMVVVWGIPALVRMAVYMEGLGSAGKTADKTDNIPPGPPSLVMPYDATNSAQQDLWGNAEPGSNVVLFQNSSQTTSVTAADDGSYRFASVILKDGINRFKTEAVDASGNKSRMSDEEVIYYSNKQPSLNLESPKERQNVTGSNSGIEIKGTTDAGVRLTVNDRVFIVDGVGRFGGTFYLSNGENLLVIVAKDQAGNLNRKEMTVIYNP